MVALEFWRKDSDNENGFMTIYMAFLGIRTYYYSLEEKTKLKLVISSKSC